MAKSNTTKQVKKTAPKVKKTTVAKKSAAAPKKSAKALSKGRAGHKWVAPFMKSIPMYKEPADYFHMNEKYRHTGIATRLIHAGNEPDPVFGGVVPAINMSTTYAQPSPGVPVVFDYSRCGNPTRMNLERCLASMEGANFAFATSSGMAATVTMMNLLQSGDHILCIDDVYGGTQRYLRKILTNNHNVELDMLDFGNIPEFRKALKPNTKIVWLETPTNPTLKIYDIAKIAKELKGRGIIFVVDNTFATSINQQPLSLGADIVMHSLTKYVGGHSDVLAGAMMLNDKALYDRLFFVLKTMGTGLAPFDSWVVLRGCKTLEVRVNRAGSNAMAIAHLLEKSKKVAKVVYPGLKSHPSHHIAKKQCTGFGGMLSFYIKGGLKQSSAFLKGLKYFTLAESLGGVESLAECPAIMTHGSVPAAHRAKLGIEDNFIRLSVGIESEKDLLWDITQALAKA